MASPLPSTPALSPPLPSVSRTSSPPRLRIDVPSPAKRAREDSFHLVGSPMGTSHGEQSPSVRMARELRELMDQSAASEMIVESACNFMLEPLFPPSLAPRFMELMRGFARLVSPETVPTLSQFGSASRRSLSQPRTLSGNCCPSPITLRALSNPSNGAAPSLCSASSSSPLSSISPAVTSSSSVSCSSVTSSSSINSSSSSVAAPSSADNSLFLVPAPVRPDHVLKAAESAPSLADCLWTVKGVTFLSPRGKFNLHATSTEVVLAANNQASLLRFPLRAASRLLLLADWNQRDMMVAVPLSPPAVATKNVVSVVIIKLSAAVAVPDDAIQWGGANNSGELKARVETMLQEQQTKLKEEQKAIEDEDSDHKSSRKKGNTSAKMFDLLSALLSSTLDRPIDRSEPSIFQSFNKKSAGIQTYVKATPGSLYFVREGILSLNKSGTVFFPIEEIEGLKTLRSSARFVNLVLEAQDMKHEFEMIAGEELEGITEYTRFLQSRRRASGKRKSDALELEERPRGDRPPRRTAALLASQPGARGSGLSILADEISDDSSDDEAFAPSAEDSEPEDEYDSEIGEGDEGEDEFSSSTEDDPLDSREEQKE